MEEEGDQPRRRGSASADGNKMVINALCRMLGIPNQKPGQGVTYLSYDENFGPSLTLLDVDFTLAPGYMVWKRGGQRPPRRKGEEPRREKGNIWVNKFPGQTKVVAVPYYLLAEQVAQIMRYLKLPREFVVSLKPALPKDPLDKQKGKDSLYRMPSTGLAVGRENRFGAGFKLALGDRNEGKITMLPRHNEDTSRSQVEQRVSNETERPSGAAQEPALRLVFPGVGEIREGEQRRLDRGAALDQMLGGDVLVPGSSGGVPARSVSDGGRKRRAVDEEDDTIAVIEKDVHVGQIGGDELDLDPDVIDNVLSSLSSPDPASTLYSPEFDGEGVTMMFGDDVFDWNF